MSEQSEYEEYPPQKSLMARLRDRFLGSDVDEEEVEPLPNRRGSLRIDSARGVCVAVRLSATSFNDARTAADGLKSGQQQIVNFDRADPATAERLLDFLNGVTFALDGSVERVGEKVYLFAPANVRVEVEGADQHFELQ